MEGSDAAARYQAVFESAAEAMLVFDPIADRIVDANASAERLLGFAREELLNMRMSALHPRQLPELIAFTDEVLERGHAWTGKLECRRADGRPLRVEYSAAVSRNEDGLQIAAIVYDSATRQLRRQQDEARDYLRQGIGEWRGIEHVFRELERENRLILHAAGEGIYGVDADGNTTFVNPAAERMLGWRAGELVGRDMHTAVHHMHADGSHYPSRQCPIYAAFRDGAVHRVDDEVFWRKDGTPITVEYTSTPIRDRGRLVGAVVVFRDITRRKEAEERLRAALDEVNELRERLEQENAYLQEEIETEFRHGEIIGRSSPMAKVIRQIELVAPTEASVLVVGESGTGKELIARAIHGASTRSKRPLIRVNCAAIPRELFESEFFGHARGAFTGALRDRVGRFELADGGTLFLDEIGEIPTELQGKLLRVLQDGQFERVGEERTRQVDVRLIAATNRDLKAEVRRGRFREDLYFRLNVFPIESVPLRERIADIPLLAAEFLERACRRANKTGVRLSQGDIRALGAYDWPGNVRELENVIERAVILSQNGRLRLELPERVPAPAPNGVIAPQASQTPEVLTEDDRRRRDRDNLRAALETCNGKIYGPGGAAELLGMRPTTLASRMKALGITRPRAGY
ncbi:MAG: sigma 54-interacting transcriptional regulator [Ectothiorhodospiraceae bacterium]|nr:sigma 54-interacting transcriptional regulator [Ectothiorhodospiraceae bacterium]